MCVLILLDSLLMVNLNVINQKACLINWNNETMLNRFFFYQILFSINFLDCILMVSLNINNQKHLLLIDFIK